MRVISGSARGRKLKVAEGRAVRPTTDKVKEAVFSALQFDLADACVLDLFAGSGQMGIEALSRGAKSAYFVDISPRSLAVVRENLKTTNLLDQARIYQSDAVDFLQAVSQKFEIAILDPPYRKEMLIHVLPLLEFAMRKSGLVVCEHETELHLSAEYGFLKLQKQKKYGTVTITTYQCRRDEI